MNLQAASASDYPVLLKIWEDSVRASHDFLPEERLQALKSLLLDSYFPQVNLWLWQDAAQQRLGFVGVAEANIEMLFVQPQAQGLGIGKARPAEDRGERRHQRGRSRKALDASYAGSHEINPKLNFFNEKLKPFFIEKTPSKLIIADIKKDIF